MTFTWVRQTEVFEVVHGKDTALEALDLALVAHHFNHQSDRVQVYKVVVDADYDALRHGVHAVIR